MPQRKAKRNSLVVAVALCLPFALFFAYSSSATPVSFVSRCGGALTTFLYACWACMGVGSFASAYGLGKSVLKRPKGHPLNAIQMRYAACDAIYGALFVSIFLGISRAPCWALPLFVWVAAVAKGFTGFTAVRQEPLLEQVPNFNQQLAALDARIARLNEAPGQMSEAEDREAAGLLSDVRETLKAIERFNGNEGAQS